MTKILPKFLCPILIVFSFAQTQAQQELQHTLYWNNYSIFNPAASGLFNKHYASVNLRHQWVGFESAPKTICGLYDLKMSKWNSGLGFNYIYDKLGAETNNKLSINYAYQIKLKRGILLSSGVSFAFLRKTIDFGKFAPIDDGDPLLKSKSINSDNYFNIGLGTILKTEHLLAGFSVSQVNKQTSDEIYYSTRPHYYLFGTYKASIGENFTIEPKVLFKSDMASSQIDINCTTIYKKRYWTGFTYRSNDAIAFIAGIDIKGKYRIGYAYDYTISYIKNVSKGSHEIILTIMAD